MSKFNLTAAIVSGFCWLPNVLASETVFLPTNQNSAVELGPVIFTPERLTFANGRSLAIEFFPIQGAGETLSLYKVKEANGAEKTLGTCAEQIRFVSVRKSDDQEHASISFLDFDPAVDGPNKSACATYSVMAAAMPEVDEDGATVVGKWDILADEGDDGTVLAGLPADSPMGKDGKPYHFVARCIENTTTAFLALPEPVPGRALLVFIYKDGVSTKKMRFWPLNNDGTWAFVPGWAGDLLKEIADADTVTFNIAPEGRTDVDVRFDIRGMKEALETLSTRCNWSF